MSGAEANDDGAWAALDAELDLWSGAGRAASIWWRDDDAVAHSAALDRLLALAAAHGLAPALAAIPAALEPSLARRLEASSPAIAVLQHGYAHQNHAPPDDRRIELGPHRPAMQIVGELGAGRMAMETAFGARALPVLVPPWNRIDPRLVPMLPEIGFRALSAFGIRKRAEPVRGFVQVNAHVDPVEWRGSRGFVGDAAALAALAGHLAARRAAGAGSPAVADEPTGVLSHHLAHDDATWRFLDRLWGRLRRHPAVRILGPEDVFPRAAA